MACYSESNLAKYKVDLSAKSNARQHKTYNPDGKITKITVHHMAGVMSAKSCAELHRNNGKTPSANYYIGVAGEIAEGVPESRRAWTSGSAVNDYQSITIEVSNSVAKDPWPVSADSWNALIKLCTDICQRNHIKKLSYTGNSSGNLTIHKMFQKTVCPGPYLEDRMDELADMVNENLMCLNEDTNAALYYQVKRGDTLTKICFMYDTTIAQLVKLNNIKNINRIYVGQRLRVR